MDSGNERGPGNELGALTEQFPHLGNYTLIPVCDRHLHTTTKSDQLARYSKRFTGTFRDSGENESASDKLEIETQSSY